MKNLSTKFKNIIDENSEVGLLIIDSSKKILYANSVIEKLFEFSSPADNNEFLPITLENESFYDISVNGKKKIYEVNIKKIEEDTNKLKLITLLPLSKNQSENYDKLFNKYLNEAFESGNFFVYRFNVRKDRYEMLTESVYNITKYSKQEFLQNDLNYSKIALPEDRLRISNQINQLGTISNERKSNIQLDYRITDKNGDIRTLKDYATITFDGKGNIETISGVVTLVGSCNERDCQKYEEYLLDFLENATDGFFDIDMANNKAKVNSKLAKRLNIELDKDGYLSLDNWIAFVHPDDLSYFNSMMQYHIQNGTSHFDAEVRLKTATGNWLWYRSIGKVVSVDETGTPVRIIGIDLIIDNYKKNESDLNLLQKKFNSTINRASDGLVLINNQGKVEAWNHKLEDLTGLMKQNVMDKYIWDVYRTLANSSSDEDIQPEHTDQLQVFVMEILRSGKSEYMGVPIESKIRRANGSQRIVEFTFFVYQNGNLYNAGCYVKDVTASKIIENDLKSVKGIFDEFISNSKEVLYRYDITSNVFDYFTNAVYDITGYTANEILNFGFQGIVSRIHPEDISNFEQSYFNLKHFILKNDNISIEYRFLAKDGRYINLRDFQRVLYDDNNKPIRIIGHIQDLTVANMKENKYKAVTGSYEKMLDNHLFVSLLITADGSIKKANKYFEELFETNSMEIQNFNIFELLGVENHAEFKKAIIKTQKLGKISNIETDIKTSRGWKCLKWELNTAPSGADKLIVASAADVTREVDMIKKTRSSKDYYKNLFESANDAIVVFDPIGELILDVNQKACELYKLEKQNFVGKSLINFTKDIVKGKMAIEESQNSLKQQKFESIHFNSKGEEMILEITGTVVQYEGKPAILSINRDITRRRKIDAKLQASEEQFRMIFDNSLIAKLLVDKDLRIVKANEGFIKQFNLTSNDAVNELLSKYIVKSKYTEIVGNISKLTEGTRNHLQCTTELITADNVISSMQLNISALPTSESHDLIILIEITKL